MFGAQSYFWFVHYGERGSDKDKLFLNNKCIIYNTTTLPEGTLNILWPCEYLGM